MNQLPVMLLIDLIALLKRKVAIKSFVLYSAWGKSLLIVSSPVWASGPSGPWGKVTSIKLKICHLLFLTGRH
jgi:hypothetical protein